MDIKTLTPDDNGQVDWPALSPDRKAVVTVGVFDGMHQGHCAVIGKVVELARQTDSFAVVVLFDPRPGLVHRYAAEHDGAAWWCCSIRAPDWCIAMRPSTMAPSCRRTPWMWRR